MLCCIKLLLFHCPCNSIYSLNGGHIEKSPPPQLPQIISRLPLIIKTFPTLLGPITSRCLGNEPALPERRPDSRERLKSSLNNSSCYESLRLCFSIEIPSFHCTSPNSHFPKRIIGCPCIIMTGTRQVCVQKNN